MRERNGLGACRLSNNTHAINTLYDQCLLWCVLLQAGQFDHHTRGSELDYYPEPHGPSIKLILFLRLVTVKGPRCDAITAHYIICAINFNETQF